MIIDCILIHRPDKCKWVTLRAKKSMPSSCNIQMFCGDTCIIEMKPANIFITQGFQMKRIELCAREPGEFQVQFTVVGDCSDLVEVHIPTDGIVALLCSTVFSECFCC